MSNFIPESHKHLTIDDRTYIQKHLIDLNSHMAELGLKIFRRLIQKLLSLRLLKAAKIPSCLNWLYLSGALVLFWLKVG